MEIGQFQVDTGTLRCVLEDPTTGEIMGDENGETAVLLLSPESKEYKALAHEYTNRRLKKMRPGRPSMIDAAELEVQNVEMLARAIKGFENLTYNGDVPKSLAEIKALLVAAPFIRSQCEAFLQDERNFLKTA